MRFVPVKTQAHSAATINRLLRDVREQAFSGQRRRAGGIGSAIRGGVPIRTFTDLNDPLPDYFEIDFVERCGVTKIDGDSVRSLVLTDIATRWTECLTMPFRSGALVVEHIKRSVTTSARQRVSNGPARLCSRKTIRRGSSKEWRHRAPPRCYDRLGGLEATETLAYLYQVSRLYINFFQPSFKLQSKTRHGAKVTNRCEAPLTPLERVLRSAWFCRNNDTALKFGMHKLCFGSR